MKLFDSHCHLNDDRFDQDYQQVISGFNTAQVDKALCVGYDLQSSAKAVQIANEYDNIYASVGIHPHDAKTVTQGTLDQLYKLSQNKKVVAYGEIGLDYYYDHSERDLQKQVFEKQLQLSGELNLPVIIHARDAWQDTLDILKSFKLLNGVMHCFTGSKETAKICMDMGLYISLSGVVAFKNAEKAKTVAEYIPLDRLLIETDSPYQAPVPHRGKRNIPQYVYYVAKIIAELKGIAIEQVAQCTYDNAINLFNIRE